MSWMGRKGCEILCCSLFSSWDAGPCGPTAKPTLASGLAGGSWEGFHTLKSGSCVYVSGKFFTYVDKTFPNEAISSLITRNAMIFVIEFLITDNRL